MLTLSYGYKKPQNTDLGSVFFPAMVTNIQQLNDHNHNGINSAALTATSITKTTQAIAAGSWVATSGGRYKQTVTLPALFTYLGTQMSFTVNGGTHDGAMVFPSIEKGPAANQYIVYVNDNTLALTALYV